MRKKQLLVALLVVGSSLAIWQDLILAEEAVAEYKNSAFGISFKYPSSWNAMTPEEIRVKTKGMMGENDLAGMIITIVNDRDPDKNFNLKSFPVAKESLTDEELKQLGNYFEREYKKMVPGYSKVASQIVTVSDIRGLESIFDSVRVDKHLRQRSIILVKGGRDYVLTFTSPKEFFADADKACFQTILATFRIQ